MTLSVSRVLRRDLAQLCKYRIADKHTGPLVGHGAGLCKGPDDRSETFCSPISLAAAKDQVPHEDGATMCP